MPDLRPHDYQPRLTWWGHAWRGIAVAGISAAAWYDAVRWQWQHDVAWLVVDLAIGLFGFVIMHWRRQHPVTVTALCLLLASVSYSIAGPSTLALASMATRRRWREIVPLSLLSVLTGVLIEQLTPEQTNPVLGSLALLVAVTALTVGWGMYIGSRRELLETLRERARSAERDQATRVAQARTAERARLAREMHDVLAHRISLVAMQSGALTYRADLAGEEVRKVAGVIEENSHRALAELREVLGVLRADADSDTGSGSGDAPRQPQPTMSDVPAMVEEARRGGMRVELIDELEDADLPESLSRTIYRVLQEALTNAHKHAPGAVVRAHVSGALDEEVVVEVSNPLSPEVGRRRVVPESGLGLVGLAERAELVGGSLQHGLDDGCFRLTVRLPWQLPQAPDR